MGVMRYAVDEDISGERQFLPLVISGRIYAYVNPKTKRWNRPSFPEKSNKALTAAELAFKPELGPVLVFWTTPAFAEAVGKALLQRLTLMRHVEETSLVDLSLLQQIAHFFLPSG